VRRVRKLEREVEESLMKIIYSRARQLETAAFLYSPARGLRTVYYVKEDSWSRVRRAESGY